MVTLGTCLLLPKYVLNLTKGHFTSFKVTRTKYVKYVLNHSLDSSVLTCSLEVEEGDLLRWAVWPWASCLKIVSTSKQYMIMLEWEIFNMILKTLLKTLLCFALFFFYFHILQCKSKCTYSKCDAGKIGPHFGTICLYPLYRKQCCVNTNMCLILENLL